MGITFGTEGWRGIMGQDFDMANVRLVGRAVVAYLQGLPPDKKTRPVVIGYDTRSLSQDYARELACVISAGGIPVLLSNKAVITPALSLATVQLNAGLGLMITASHNPPQYNGIKFKGPYGGPIDEDTIAGIEACLRGMAGSPSMDVSPGGILHGDFDALYLPAVGKLFKDLVIHPSNLKVVVDTMHGVGRGYFDRLLEEKGVEVIRVREEVIPDFGGICPEPVEAHLGPLKAAVISHQADLGVATDGDGDRIGIVDNTGAYVDAHRVFLLLLTHLYENRGQRGSVIKTFSTSFLVEMAAESFGLKVRETPIGFKHIAPWCLKETVVLGGEESGGYGFPWHLPDRDGVLAGLLLVEYIVQSGKTLNALVEESVKRFGPSVYRRVDLLLSTDADENGKVRGLPAVVPSALGRRVVTGVATLDGLKLKLGEEGWMLFRISGTEPLLRVYAEAISELVLDEIMTAGIKWVNESGYGSTIRGV
ncbi:MAG: phosphoglucomutase/phosphomannomutase family protein [Firmicutes bacterium]|nr:phosphoglucomutase/phosphomannomutase family protein [Bacillota bacterium]